MTGGSRWTFVVSSSDRRSRRDHELQLSEIKAHAAKISRHSKTENYPPDNKGADRTRGSGSVPVSRRSSKKSSQSVVVLPRRGGRFSVVEPAHLVASNEAPRLPPLPSVKGVDPFDCMPCCDESIEGVTKFGECAWIG